MNRYKHTRTQQHSEACKKEQEGRSGVGACALKGFTLLEVIVSFAILALVAVSLYAAIMGVMGVQERTNQMRVDSSAVESNIASGKEPTESIDDRKLPLGNYTLDSASNTYAEGLGAYTILGVGSTLDPQNDYFDGNDGGRESAKEYEVLKTGYYRLEVWGASGGGNGFEAGLTRGGLGGYATGIVKLKKNDTLYMHAGGVGSSKVSGGVDTGGGRGGENGGGQGGWYSQANAITGGGGGASDVRVNSDSLNARVIVAGGGGGAGCNNWPNNIRNDGGAGGGLAGNPGQSSAGEIGLGGTQGAGGSTASSNGGDKANGPGTFGQGGSALVPRIGKVSTAGGGGGGWYGGGAGGFEGGGGGAGWIFTEAHYMAWTDTALKNVYLLDSSYWLHDASLTAGGNYMPDPRNNDALMPGMRGHGYVRITWIGTSLE